MEQTTKINNAIYEIYGQRWYSAYDDPIALLRAENKLKVPWIYERILKLSVKEPKVLDVGCGAGFLCNAFAEKGLTVTGLDSSPESLRIASLHDHTKKVQYKVGDAYHLPFDDESMDVITCLDFLEHVEKPKMVISECARVLKPKGLFFFHTFNRNFLSWLLIIKAVEYLVKNTPKNMHVIKLFITPEELNSYCLDVGLDVGEIVGLRPKFSTIPLKSYFSGVVPRGLEFTLSNSLMLSYMGMATKR